MKRLLTLTVAAAVMSLVACGGDETPAAEETTTSVVTTTAAPTTTTTTAPPTTTPTTAAPTTTTTTTAAPTTTTVALTPAQEAFLEALGKARAGQIPGRAEVAIAATGLEGAVEGAEVAFVMSMEFDKESGDFAWSVDLSGLADLVDPDDPEMQGFADLFGSDLNDLFSAIEVRQIGDTAYMKFPFLSMLFGIETEWMSFPAEDAGVAGEFTPVAPVDPQDFLDTFGDAVPDVTEVGVESIRGAEVVHYIAVFDVQQLAGLEGSDPIGLIGDLGDIPTLSIDFWMGKDGSPHRISFYVDATGFDRPGESGFETMSVVFDFFDHGAVIEIEPPPTDQVTDATELMGLFGT